MPSSLLKSPSPGGHALPALLLCLTSTLLACSEPTPTLSSLDVSPRQPFVVVNQTERLIATGFFSDGAREDLTESVTWESSDPSVVRVSMEPGTRGTLLGNSPGVATVSAVSGNSGKRAQVTVTVKAPPPTVSSLSPETAPASGGTSITVRGAWLVEGTTLTIGGAALVNPTRVDDTTLTGTTPPGVEGVQDVVVTNANGASTLTGRFRYTPPLPTLVGILPNVGPPSGGTTVYVSGAHFTQGTTVTIGGVALWNPVLINDTLIGGTAPQGTAGFQDVVVTSANGSATLAGGFRYYDAWMPSSVGLSGSYPWVLVRAPDVASTLYAGTYRSGLFKSTDSGLTWTPINNGFFDFDIYDLAIDPRTPSTLYASTGFGLYKSTDGGAQWFKPSPSLFFGGKGLVIDPTAPEMVYASAGNQGVYKSTDGGVTWNPINAGLGQGFYYVESLAIDPANPRILYVGMGSGGAIFKTTDGGASWSPAHSGVPNAAGSIRSLVIHPTSSGTLYAAGTVGLYKSTDGGGSWSSVITGNASINALVIHPAAPDTLYAATSEGVLKSTSGGASWSPASVDLPTRSTVALLLDPSQPAALYVGTAYWGVFKTTDSGANWRAMSSGQNNFFVQDVEFAALAPDTAYAATRTGVYKTVNSGATWQKASSGPGASGASALAVHPAGTVVYAVTTEGLYKSSDGGASWTRGFDTRFGFRFGLALHPTAPDTLYVGTEEGLFRTQNGGGQWQSLLTGQVTAIDISTATPSTMYVAVGDKVHKSTTGGTQWVEVSTGLPDSSYARQLLIQPGTTNTVYLTTFNKGIFKTVDGGASWSHVYDGNAVALAMDPTDPSTLYLGTTGDVRRTRDGGQTWQEASWPLRVYVNALALKPGAPQTLLIGTEGRGLFKTTSAGL
jgi:photosystem II stability/assembly factor-like uncharacterized protein